MKRHLKLADMRGLARLTLDGARLITDVVEETHATVLRQLQGRFCVPVSLLGASTGSRTGAIPGLVYRSIHAGYATVEAGLEVGAGLLGPVLGDGDPSISTSERERMLAILNGVWGHHLEASHNALAIEISFRCEGAPLEMDADAIRDALGTPGRKLLVLAHGLCMNDASWRQSGLDYGMDLARGLGYTPLYLHYNSGLHISTNGHRFAALLERLVAEWPEPVEELTVLGFSMGGLIARSAAHYGEIERHAWRSHLRRLVFLGAPHHGSHLERAGSWADYLLESTSYSAPFKRLGATRSAGITDLRHGSVVDEDWHDTNWLDYRHDIRRPVPLPNDVQCYTLAATLGATTGDAQARLLGDGIVPLDSALGHHRDPERDLAFSPSRSWVGFGMRHVDLLRSPEVYAKLYEWLAS